jgi:hypothetical protein
MNSSLVQDSEEAPPLALYDNALPTQGLLQQGRIDCCWLVASVASLLRSWRNWVKETLVPPANADGTFTVNFPGNPITVSTPIGDGNTYSPGNGDGFWLSVLEKAAGQYYYNQTYWAWPYTPYDYINEGKYPQYFIPVLTGDAVEDDYFRFTNDDDTANRLTTAFNNNKVVVASTFGSPAAGLIPKHSYGVVGWDAETNQVTLYNPHGSNPNYTVVVPASGNQPAREETRNLSSSGDGYFTMPLYQFTRSFSYIDYEL